LIAIDPDSGKTAILQQFPFYCDALTFSNNSGLLYVSGRFYSNNEKQKQTVVSVNPNTGAVNNLFESKENFFDTLYYDDNSKLLFAVDNNKKKLFKTKLNPVDKPIYKLDEFIDLKSKSTQKTIDQPVYDITGINKTDLLYAITDRLVTVDLKTGIVDDEKFVKGFLNEMSPLFLEYVKPMRRIKEKKGLTYLYTFKLTDTKDLYYDYEYLKQKKVEYKDAAQIVYIIDANLDENHTAIGYVDSTQAEDQLRDVLFKGNVYLTDIKDWEEWGLIKSGNAPIRNSNREIKAIAGADVNVTIIQAKTRMAMLKVALVAILALALSGFISLLISKRIIRPIEQLKEIALGIAAGRFGKQIEIGEPLELADLSTSFNTMSLSLKETIVNLEQINQDHEKNRQQDEMIRLLKKESHPEYTDISILSIAEPDIHNAGWNRWNNILFLWILENDDQKKNVHLSSIISIIVKKISEYHSGQWKEISYELNDLFMDSVLAFIIIDLETLKIKSILRHDFKIAEIGKELVQMENLNDKILLKNNTTIWLDKYSEIDRSISELSNLSQDINEMKKNIKKINGDNFGVLIKLQGQAPS